MIKKGFSTVEVMTGVFIITLAFLAVSEAGGRSLVVAEDNLREVQANYLLGEGVEVARLWRDDNWSNLANLTPGTSYYMDFVGGSWVFRSASAYPAGAGNLYDIFSRKFILSAVNRDATSHNIVTTGGLVDPDIKKIEVTVSWQSHGSPRSKSLTTYLVKL